MLTPAKATGLGLIAIGLWACITAALRILSSSLPVLGALALIYSLGTILQLWLGGWPKLKSFPRLYLVIGAILFVSYELCMSLSVGFAISNQQAIEVSMLNYLWPALTVWFAILSEKRLGHVGLYIGIILCLFGELLVVGQGHISFAMLLSHLASNPFSYILATTGAVLWALYCVLTKHLAKGHDGIVFFFMLVALSLWIQYALSAEAAFSMAMFSPSLLGYLALAAVAMGGGYAAWNKALLNGNVTVLAIFSYFIPVFSALIAAWQLGVALSWPFWQGCLFISLGSVLCWWVTRGRREQAPVASVS
ncbi:aromatic amino acid DMT transporter YddG [Celerinatantimonas sp. MCCC 1A17872]|uniref:aromatic amino acid DMT transporter YddG n=1 Tax=Celerinatantimonas sp. MCCC 1A17872 TaxID=3177514 RepID=UPI0038C1A7DA